jgi:hypothetical protein
MAKKNQYARHARKKHFLEGFADGFDAKGNVKNTVFETGKDLLVGVLGGGLVGSAIGKPSLLVGILTTGIGHYSGNRLAQLFGLGLMASNGFQKNASVNGVDNMDGMDGIKDRVLAYRDSFAQKFYIDKFLKKKAATTTVGAIPGTEDVGDVQYFNYGDSMGDLAALDDIEQQLADSALAYQQQITGPDMEPVGDLEPIGELADVEERLY